MSTPFYGFDIGSAKLKHEHTQVLDQYSLMIRSESARRGFAVVANGNRSRSGSAAVNAALPAQRALAVSSYLEPLVAGNGYVTPLAMGEAAAEIDGLPDGFESERHRSVLLVAVDYKKTDPPPPRSRLIQNIPKSILPTINPRGRFPVQLPSGHEGSAGLPLPGGFSAGGQVTRFKLRFRDLGRGVYSDFMLFIVSYKRDWGSPGSLEKLEPGPEQFFHADPELRIWDLPGLVDYEFASIDFGTALASLGYFTCWRELDPSGGTAYLKIKIPPGKQAWEFGKFGAGEGSGKGYLSIA